jgi:Fe-S cluster assembly protein SufD
MIKALPGSQRIDGFQANRNLMLDKTARADSIPGLEIEADDVRCTHASAIGKLDEEELFYLMSRGIPGKRPLRCPCRVSLTHSCAASPSKASGTHFWPHR